MSHFSFGSGTETEAGGEGKQVVGTLWDPLLVFLWRKVVIDFLSERHGNTDGHSDGGYVHTV